MNFNYLFHIHSSKLYPVIVNNARCDVRIYLRIFDFVDWTERLLQDELQQGRNHLPVNILELGLSIQEFLPVHKSLVINHEQSLTSSPQSNF